MNLQPTQPPIPAGQVQPENSVPVIVALRDIPAGSQITPDMLGVMYAPRTIASESDFTIVSDFGGFFGNVEDVQYMYTTRPIARFQPIQPASISADPVLRNVDGQVQASAPDGMVTVNLQVAEPDIFRRIQALEHVAVVAADQSDSWTWDLDWRTGEESLALGVIVSDALVLSTQISESPDGEIIRSITIAVTQEVAAILQDMVARETPFVVIPQD